MAWTFHGQIQIEQTGTVNKIWTVYGKNAFTEWHVIADFMDYETAMFFVMTFSREKNLEVITNGK